MPGQSSNTGTRESISGHLLFAALPAPTVSQSGFSCLRMQTASSVICTSGGGLGNELISTMSFWRKREVSVQQARDACRQVGSQLCHGAVDLGVAG